VSRKGFLVCIGAAAAVSCAHPGSGPDALGDRVPLLGGRLSLRPPRGTKTQPRSALGVLGANEPDEDETRLRLEQGDEVLVILANEWFALAVPDEERTRAPLREVENRTGPLKVDPFVSGSVRGWIGVPDRIAFEFDDPEAGLVLTMLLVQPDGTLQGLAIFANRALSRREADTVALARRIAATVEGGDKRIGAESDRVLSLLGAPGRLRLHLPKGFAVSTQTGPDFLVHRLRKLVPIGEPAPIAYLYSGFHPQDVSEPGEEPRTRSGTLLGKAVQWSGSRSSDGLLQAHAQVADLESPAGDANFRPVFDVVVFASSIDDLAALMAIAESARLAGGR
jgi:hypothetical protein